MAKLKHYIIQVLIAVDQLANAFLGGWADETISARAYRQAKSSNSWKVFEVIINLIFFLEDIVLFLKYKVWPVKRHCERAYEAERKREQYPPEYRI